MDSNTPATVTLTLLDTALVQCTLVACMTLLIYDYICTLDQEVAYVWKNFQWSVGVVLFLLNRYLPFIDTFVSLRLKLSYVTPETCDTQFKVVSWFIVTGIIISETILLLRTYALWERKRWVVILLAVTATAAFIPAIVITQLEILSLRYVQNDFPGCRVSQASPIVIVAYILLMVLETTMAVLTGIKAFRHLRHSNSPWVVQLYRDGLMFYVYLTCISIANVLVPILAPRTFSNWLATPQRVMHSVLCTRVLFLILKQRNAANMTVRRPGRRSGGSPRHQDPVFTSFYDEELSTNMTIIPPNDTDNIPSIHDDNGGLDSMELSDRTRTNTRTR
ncbi:unnamed protein product [Cyclocybe aegerita]|uniref:DUF6533 domain-containing protein n=1 Tax=Cyclocybe aegerita TaxID=1973307 RepID=A0A8S0VTZ9_CYCAE|nr:unnamed protein product [Cyclocybe aegerita]